MLKTNIYIYLLLFLAFSCSKNKPKVEATLQKDSISFIMTQAEDIKNSQELRYKYSQRAIDMLSSNNDSIQKNILERTAKVFFKIQKEKEFRKSVDILLKKSINTSDSLYIAKSYSLLANHYYAKSQNDSAYFFVLKSEKLFHKVNDSLSLGENYIDKAFIQLFENDFSGCELSSIQALSLLKNFKIHQRDYDAYNLIGISSNELKNYENALTYHTKALEVAKKHKLNPKYHFEANSRNNIGVVFQNLDKHKEAIKSFQEALGEKNLLEDYPSLYAIIIDNLAYSKFKLEDFKNLPNLFYQSLKIREENDMYSGVIANKIHLSEFFAFKKDTLNAKKFATEALELAKTTKISGDLLGSLKQLSRVEQKNASQYSKEYIRISDSLQQQERKAKDKFARIAFETDEILQQKDKLAEQNRSLLYFFVATLLIGLLLFVIRAQRAKNRELMLRESQQKANEEIYNLMISQQASIEESRVKEKKRIAQELHDGVLGRLFGARLNLDSLNRATDEEAIVNRFNYLAELKNIEQDIREISHDLNREKYVLINNFLAIVNNLLDQQNNSYDAVLKSNINTEIKWENISNSIKINLYRILQESLQNINKYANAKNIEVEIIKQDDMVLLRIIDDGIGFEMTGKKKGIGLQNMLSRANECGGQCDVKSTKGNGTIITVSVPLTEIKAIV